MAAICADGMFVSDIQWIATLMVIRWEYRPVRNICVFPDTGANAYKDLMQKAVSTFLPNIGVRFILWTLVVFPEWHYISTPKCCRTAQYR